MLSIYKYYLNLFYPFFNSFCMVLSYICMSLASNKSDNLSEGDFMISNTYNFCHFILISCLAVFFSPSSLLLDSYRFLFFPVAGWCPQYLIHVECFSIANYIRPSLYLSYSFWRLTSLLGSLKYFMIATNSICSGRLLQTYFQILVESDQFFHIIW